MARYELRRVGVYDRDNDVVVLPGDGHAWFDYQLWISDHANVPDPLPPEPVPPPPPPINFYSAGDAREQRKLAKQAKADPVLQAALDLMKGRN